MHRALIGAVGALGGTQVDLRLGKVLGVIEFHRGPEFSRRGLLFRSCSSA
jgi:hypothetical protein